MNYIIEWDKYLLDYLEEARKTIENIPDNPNKGIQFELLVEYLLSQMFSQEELSFKNTKLSHDGNKDFWAIDNLDEVWWAECKNYAPNIALTQLAPTLVMAEINEVSHLMFFSYSSLNINLKKRIAQYSYKYKKEIFLYDDTALEQLIFLYDKKVLPQNYHAVSCKFSEKLETIFFNEINASIVNRNSFDENYEITELNVGSIYDLNVILINRYYNTSLNVKVKIADNESNLYFGFLDKELNVPLKEWEKNLTLKPNQIILIKYSVVAKKEKEKITLPQISVTYEKDGGIIKENSNLNHHYVCNWNKKVILIGKQYEKIIQDFSNECQKKFCSLLVYGTGGTGKTRILEECKCQLIKKNYNIINFIGFDNTSSWRDIVIEIAFQVFGLEKDLASSILFDVDETKLLAPEDPFKIKIINFLRLLKKGKTIDNLEDYYEIIFSELNRNKYAIIIDNLQSYSVEIIDFLKKLISFFGTHIEQKNSFALLMSLNTSLVYDNKYLDFVSSIQTMSFSGNNTSVLCENITGFVKEEQAITYLKTLLCLDDYPLNYKYLKETLAKSSLKPKYIELVAGRLFQEECIELKNNKGIITDAVKFKHTLEHIPPKYEDAFCSNFRHLQSVYPLLEDDFKDILACTYFFNTLSQRIIDIFKLNKGVILELCKRDILKKSEYVTECSYEFEHDLVEMTICEKIYPDLIEHAILLIMKHSDSFNSTLKDQYDQYILCKLFSRQISKDELISVFEHKERIKINNKFIYKFYSYFMDNLIQLKSEFECTTLICYMCDCCKYVRDHVSEIKAEPLFELAYAHLNSIPRATQEIMTLYFSFIIHYCENKIRLNKVSDCMVVYKDYYREIERSEKICMNLNMQFSYAKAYLDNRIFVCGKLEGFPKKYLINLASSIKTSQKNQFWDIQLENYFDLANIYLGDNVNVAKALYNLSKGFNCYNKLTKVQQRKYSVNYYSKKILYLMLKHEYSSSLDMIHKALIELKENTFINYHIFFQEKYIKYQIINLLLQKKIDSTLDKCMENYEQLLNLTGHLNDNYEWIFIQAKYAFYTHNYNVFENLVKQFYINLCANDNLNSNKNHIMLEELAIKYRQQNGSCNFICNRAADVSDINKILTMDTPSFQQFFNEYKSTAPITSEDYKDGYYI